MELDLQNNPSTEHEGGAVSHRSALTKSTSRGFDPDRLPAELNQEELNLLFAECIPRLTKTARRMLRNKEDSEDVLQESLLLAYRKLDQFEGRASFSTWLHSILRNTASGFYRRLNCHTTSCSTEEIVYDGEVDVGQKEFVDAKPNPEQNYVQEERSAIFRGAVRTLPTHYESVLHLFYTRGLGEADTARHLGISVGALKARLHRGRTLLMRRLRQRHVKGLYAKAFPNRHRTSARNRTKTFRSQLEVGMLR